MQTATTSRLTSLGEQLDKIQVLARFRGRRCLNLPFYKAITFTLVFTFVVTPLVIVLGFVVAVAVNSAVKAIRGPLIFFSLLADDDHTAGGGTDPVSGWWMRAALSESALQYLAGDPDLSVKASTPLTVGHVDGLWRVAFARTVCLYCLLCRACSQ